jgi:hypothetical protein
MMPRGPIESEGTFDGLSGSAILFGAFVDIAATLILSTLLALWLAPDLSSRDEAVARQALEKLHDSNTYIQANVALGALCTAIGAFVGARRAGQLHVRHGGWIAVTSTALGVLLTLLEPAPASTGSIPLWVEVTTWLLILPAGMTGGALAAAVSRARPE